MAYPDHLLSRGETVVLHKHPHWKVLVLPVVAFVIVVGGGAALIAWIGHWQDRGFTSHTPWYIGTVVVGVVLLVWWVLVPFLRWGTEHFVVSTAHVFFRTGILRRREHQIPLGRIQNMETEVTFWGRLLGFGSLIVDSAADQPLEFENVASLSKVQATLNQLISDDRGHRSDVGDGMGSAGGWTGYPPGTGPAPVDGAHRAAEFDPSSFDAGGPDAGGRRDPRRSRPDRDQLRP